MVKIARFTRKLCALTGMALSVYLFNLKLAGGQPYCPATGFINCATVLHSAYSLFLGLPVPFYGMFWFLLLYALPTDSPKKWLTKTSRLLVISGGVFVVYLVVVELFLLHHLCLWCSATHVVALLGIISYFWEHRKPRRSLWSSRYDFS